MHCSALGVADALDLRRALRAQRIAVGQRRRGIVGMTVLMVDQMHGEHEVDVAVAARMQARFGAVLHHVMIQLRGVIERVLITDGASIVAVGMLVFDQVNVHFDGRVEVRATQVAVVNARRRQRSRRARRRVNAVDEKATGRGR